MIVSSQTGLPHLPDSLMIPHEQYGRIIFYRFVFLSAWLPLGEILAACESPEHLHGLENVTSALHQRSGG